jgi:WD40 repeat protein
MSFIFVSYRRSDAPAHAGRLYDRLVERFGRTNVFKDLDSMEPGADFVEAIEETIGRCDALVAVIGRDWLRAEHEGVRRLEDPEDWVRLEIVNALRRRIRVVPVLVQGALMPAPLDLPEDLQAFARRHACELSETAWNAQVDQLIDVLERALQRRPAVPAPDPREPGRQTTATLADTPLTAALGPWQWNEVARIPVSSALLAFTPDGSVLITRGAGDIQLWDTQTGRLRGVLSAAPRRGRLRSATRKTENEDTLSYARFTVSPDGRFLAASGRSGAKWVWRLDSEQLVHVIPPAPGVNPWVSMTESFFSPSGRYYTAPAQRYGSDPALVQKVWATDDWREVSVGSIELRAPFAFGAGDRWIAVAEQGQPSARIWDFEAGHEQPPLEHGGLAVILSLDAHPQDPELLVALSSSHATIWRVGVGSAADIRFPSDREHARELARRHDPDSGNGAFFSPTGAYLELVLSEWEDASTENEFDQAGAVERSTIWETASGRVLSGIPDLEGEVAFTPDDRRLVTCGDGTRVWDLATERELVTLAAERHINPRVSNDSRFVATLSSPSTIRIWELDTGEELYRLDFPAKWSSFSPAEPCLAASSDEETRLYRLRAG